MKDHGGQRSDERRDRRLREAENKNVGKHGPHAPRVLSISPQKYGICPSKDSATFSTSASTARQTGSTV
jgi:hypothetical protein